MSGYQGIGPEAGVFVDMHEAYHYAIERCLYGTNDERKEFRKMLVEWYYSGNWIEIEERQEQPYG
ncbi:MAG: hypothetical protein ACRDBO_17260 [Lachnospiraceae bacterium]